LREFERVRKIPDWHIHADYVETEVVSLLPRSRAACRVKTCERLARDEALSAAAVPSRMRKNIPRALRMLAQCDWPLEEQQGQQIPPSPGEVATIPWSETEQLGNSGIEQASCLDRGCRRLPQRSGPLNQRQQERRLAIKPKLDCSSERVSPIVLRLRRTFA
jgi:hypothetical protein